MGTGDQVLHARQLSKHKIMKIFICYPRFMTDDFTSDIYTPEGLKWIQDTDMSSVLIRAFPDIKWLSDVLANTDNAFFPWPVPNVAIAE